VQVMPVIDPTESLKELLEQRLDYIERVMDERQSSIAKALELGAKEQLVRLDQLLNEIKDIKPRVTWLETKAYYAMGIIAGLAVFSSYLLKQIGVH
jgi:hypothetical protein